jgi:hypothetical protein
VEDTGIRGVRVDRPVNADIREREYALQRETVKICIYRLGLNQRAVDIEQNDMHG